MKHEDRSLPEVHGSVRVPQTRSWLRRMLAFAGPAYLVSVGYMDPGNWATDLAGGSKFGYQLVWVLVMSNLMAVLLQTLSARLGLITGRDLAQACRDFYPRFLVWPLWVLCEIAIVACDLAALHQRAVQGEIVRHDRGAEDAHGDEQGLPVQPEHGQRAVGGAPPQARVAARSARHQVVHDGGQVGL